MLVIKDLYSDISDCFWLFYGSKYNTLMCYGYDEESDTYDNEPWYIRVKSVSDTKLIIKLLNDDNQTVDDTRDCVKQ